MNQFAELFDVPIAPNLNDVIDSEPILDIDMEGIGQEAVDDATALVNNLSKLYYNEEFMSNNPTFKKRIDNELESLRVLIKMRKSDEIAHDNLMKAIANNSSNASLYRSLAEIQKTILSITSKMGEIITGLNNLMKNYQLELNFSDDDQTTEEISSSKDTHRGSKEFINQMNSMDEQQLFEQNEKTEKESL